MKDEIAIFGGTTHETLLAQLNTIEVGRRDAGRPMNGRDHPQCHMANLFPLVACRQALVSKVRHLDIARRGTAGESQIIVEAVLDRDAR